MKLHEYIAQIGDEAAAALFEVEVRTARSWRLKERRPFPDKALEIIEKTKGRVDYEGIYRE